MGRSYSRKTIQTLFARTGNQCAFPACNHVLIDEDYDDFLGEICHIEAVNSGGPRFNSKLTLQQINSSDNLIVLCHAHHVRVDNHPDEYTAESLKEIKQEHQRKWKSSSFKIPDEAIEQIIKEDIELKNQIVIKNKKWQDDFELAMPFELMEDPLLHFDQIYESISDIESLLDSLTKFLDRLPDDIESFFTKLGYDTEKYRNLRYTENPFFNAFWDWLHIGGSNYFTNLSINLLAIEYYATSQRLKELPHDQLLVQRNHELKQELLKIASSVGYTD